MASNPPDGDASTAPPWDEYTHPNRSKGGRFRFKSSSSRSTRHHDRDKEHHHSSQDDHKKRRSSPHTTKHKDETRPSKRRHRHHHSREPNTDPTQQPPLSPSAAFRESLFDALGDDEGAAYWETVYGQPIHNYAVPEVPKGPDGELEQMSDEEYAAYVRSRMWERTREGMLEEQERLRAERKKSRQREKESGQKERERWAFERAMEESLRRGAERKRRKNWEVVWREYLASWEEIGRVVEKGAGETQTETESKESSSPRLRNLLFWPVESGKRRDVSPDSVEEFMRHAPTEDLLATLKMERVRWHPDKIQHRYSALGIEEEVMRSVTEVFQIVDRMWSEERARA
ncbi:uncharacterized protein N7496_009243 [Penicillium cataractarum]|uniref:J domain-containing protein n=1 Tax=Penicillium cataractarum TaxID=2100454 RepID=A0A9W9RNL6_9EURO|nr:uncharacterized protein N7496_009243 [Penicillium cataractarum]KAJ5363530.1 hypothetical protein N7496_009243 [Penicillium cataractarum]